MECTEFCKKVVSTKQTNHPKPYCTIHITEQATEVLHVYRLCNLIKGNKVQLQNKPLKQLNAAYS